MPEVHGNKCFFFVKCSFWLLTWWSRYHSGSCLSLSTHYVTQVTNKTDLLKFFTVLFNKRRKYWQYLSHWFNSWAKITSIASLVLTTLRFLNWQLCAPSYCELWSFNVYVNAYVSIAITMVMVAQKFKVQLFLSPG